MRLDEVAKPTTGQQVMQFVDYLKGRCPLNKVDKERLKNFGSHLFKNGWVFTCGPSACDFTKGDNATGRLRLVTPEKHFKGKKDRLTLTFFKDLHDPSTNLTWGKTNSRIIDVDELDDMVSDLQHYINEFNS